MPRLPMTRHKSARAHLWRFREVLPGPWSVPLRPGRSECAYGKELLVSGTNAPKSRYCASVWTDDYRSASLQDSWTSLIPLRDPVASIYQTPAYFSYLRDTEADNQLDVITIKHIHQDAIVGVVPVRQAIVELPFAVRGLNLAALRLKSLILLGSEPMIPDDPQALDELFLLLFEQFPDSQVVDMHSIPLQSYMWRYLRSSKVISELYHTHVIHGFRESHSINIPASLDEYYGSLTRKRRYNYLRQERLLENHMGAPLNVIVIEKPESLPDLFRSIRALGISTTNRSLLSPDQFLSAADHQILRCFVLRSGPNTIGVAVGMRSNSACLIHRFFYDRSLARFSPGTTLWQVVLRYLITEGVFAKVGMGYGSPTYRFHATNIIEQKGRVLLFRRTVANRCRIFAHSSYSSALNFVKARVENARDE